MCSRRRVVAVIAVVLLHAAPASAQDSSATLARLEARLESLSVAINRIDSLASRTLTDTVTAGKLRVTVTPDSRNAMQAAATEAWDSLLIRFGQSLADGESIPASTFGGAYSQAGETVDVHAMAMGLERIAAGAIWERQDSTLVHWLTSAVPSQAPTAMAAAPILDQLVRSPALPRTACLDRDVAACASALGLQPGTDPLVAWYAPDSWPLLVGHTEGTLDASISALRPSCVDQHDTEACRRILAVVPIPPPVGQEGRRLLAQLALEAGGKGAFDRMLAGSDRTVEARLVAAAGVPIDTLLDHWVGRVLSTAHRGPAPGGGEALVVLLWSAVVLLLTVGGSRWR